MTVRRARRTHAQLFGCRCRRPRDYAIARKLAREAGEDTVMLIAQELQAQHPNGWAPTAITVQKALRRENAA